MSASECEGLRRRVCELEALLCEEQARNARLSREAQGLREEEHLTSALRRKLQDVQREKERIVLQVEQEEEHLTNTLLKKLHDVQKEKVEMERQLEQEEEYIVNKLQKQIRDIELEKIGLERKLQEERSGLLDRLHDIVLRIKSGQRLDAGEDVEPTSPPDTSNEIQLLDKLGREIERMSLRSKNFHDQAEKYRKDNEVLVETLTKLRDEQVNLKARVVREKEKTNAARAALSQQELEMEIELERVVNQSPRFSPCFRPRSRSSPPLPFQLTPTRQSPHHSSHSASSSRSSMDTSRSSMET